MSYARATKHYRAVQREVEQSPSKGIFIPNKQKNKVILISVGILILAFLKGFLFGYISSRNEK